MDEVSEQLVQTDSELEPSDMEQDVMQKRIPTAIEVSSGALYTGAAALIIVMAVFAFIRALMGRPPYYEYPSAILAVLGIVQLYRFSKQEVLVYALSGFGFLTAAAGLMLLYFLNRPLVF